MSANEVYANPTPNSLYILRAKETGIKALCNDANDKHAETIDSHESMITYSEQVATNIALRCHPLAHRTRSLRRRRHRRRPHRRRRAPRHPRPHRASLALAVVAVRWQRSRTRGSTAAALDTSPQRPRRPLHSLRRRRALTHTARHGARTPTPPRVWSVRDGVLDTRAENLKYY